MENNKTTFSREISMKLYFTLLITFITTISATEISLTADVIKVSAATAEKLNLKSPGKS